MVSASCVIRAATIDDAEAIAHFNVAMARVGGGGLPRCHSTPTGTPAVTGRAAPQGCHVGRLRGALRSMPTTCAPPPPQETEGLDLDPVVALRGATAVLEDGSKGRYFVVCDGAAVSQIIAQAMCTYEWSDWRAAQVCAAHHVCSL